MGKGRLIQVSLLFFAALLTYACLGYAAPTHITDRIEKQASVYIQNHLDMDYRQGDEIQVQINPLDPRLNLPRCTSGINFHSRSKLTPGHFSLKASCLQPQRWSLYLSGEIKLFRTVVSSRRTITRHSPLTETNLELVRHNVSSLRSGYFTDINQLRGYEAEQTISQGSMITADMLDARRVIRKGDTVVISAGESGVVEVRSEGEALQDGRLNQQIKVRNKRSGRTLKARVSGPGQVKIGR